MSYNEQYRTTRQRVLNNCGCERQRESCKCTRNTEAVRRSETNTRCGCANNNHHTETKTNCGCENNVRTTVEKSNCGCGNNTVVITEARRSACPISRCTTTPVTEGCVDTYPVAMAYVPMQQWRELYDPDSAIHRGTIFRELDLDWYPTNCRKDCRRGNNH